jgi:predicted glycosyltransferase
VSGSGSSVSLSNREEFAEEKFCRHDWPKALEVQSNHRKKIWIDLDNSPHVPFFRPIISELEKRGYSVILTARDCFQVCELAKLFKLSYKRVGRHYGKNKIAKVAGLLFRTLQIAPTVLVEKPDIAISHGSRSLILLSTILHIPCITISDYEYSWRLAFRAAGWLIKPDVVPDNGDGIQKDRILRYPGIKEDAYVPFFCPDPRMKGELGISAENLVVTVRPPATEAHYHNPESELILDAVVHFLATNPRVKIILLPRNSKQEESLRRRWSHLFVSGQILIPDHVVDGLNLLWYSDLVISGGGTMNREAAALGIPVYSVFRGKIGAVDRYLAERGRLVLLESAEDVRKRIVVRRRQPPVKPADVNSGTLQAIVTHIVAVIEGTLAQNPEESLRPRT